ncbi:hypothetical protein [Streptomyces sp. NPDC058297]|uniref:hypothetical protein n=1 Tax=Streptomyces sp. NPDC058297 TaxID=3346433 RepID=UPI0036E6EDC3
MTTGGAIDPAGIPHFTGNLDEVEKSATGVHTAAKNLAEHGHGVHSTFQGLSAFYQAPEAEKLFSSTHTIPTKADSLKGELFTVATALEDYATAVRPIVQRIEHIRAQAVTFAASVEGDDDWHKDADKVSKNTGLRSDLAAALEDFATAQNDCANKISALAGGHHYMLNPTGDKALIPKNAAFNGYSADAWEYAEKTPWGAPVEREYEGVEWLLHQTKSLVWDGFVINGFLGTLDGLSTLVGAKGLDQAGQAWKGLADAAGGLSQYLMTPYDWVLDHTLGPAEESPTEKHQKEALKGLVKGFVAYDDWKENPARAAGTFGFNALTAAAGAGGGAAARGGAGARVVAGLGKAGRFVDPMTYIGKAGSFTVVKVGDAFSALKSLHGTPTTVHLADGGSFTAHEPTAGLPERPAAIPRDAIPGTDELGRTVYLDTETGHLLNTDGTIHQHVNDAVRELPAEQHATAHSDTTTPAQMAGEPELVGAHAGSNSVGSAGHPPTAHDSTASPAGREATQHPSQSTSTGGGGHHSTNSSGETPSRADGDSQGSGNDLSAAHDHPNGAAGSDGEQHPPRAEGAGAGHSELTPAERQRIQAEHIRKANEDPVWREKHYDLLGRRREVGRLVDGATLPQLAKDAQGKWIAADHVPHGPSEVKFGSKPLSPDTVPDGNLPELNTAAKNREVARNLTNATKAFENTPNPATEQALAKAQETYTAQLGDLPNNSKIPEALGEKATEFHVIPHEFPGAVEIDLPKTANGADMFDKAYDLGNGELLIAEAKAPSGDLDWRHGGSDPEDLAHPERGDDGGAKGMKVKQGTLPYMRTILGKMTRRGGRDAEIAKELRDALRAGKLRYVLVKANDPVDGAYAGAMFANFKI